MTEARADFTCWLVSETSSWSGTGHTGDKDQNKQNRQETINSITMNQTKKEKEEKTKQSPKKEPLYKIFYNNSIKKLVPGMSVECAGKSGLSWHSFIVF